MGGRAGQIGSGVNIADDDRDTCEDDSGHHQSPLEDCLLIVTGGPRKRAANVYLASSLSLCSTITLFALKIRKMLVV